MQQSAAASKRLSRSHIQLGNAFDLVAALENMSEGSVLVVGGGNLLAPTHLRNIATAAERSNIAVGYIASDSAATVVHRLKLLGSPLMDPPLAKGCDLIMDVIGGDDISKLDIPMQIETLTIHCHSEGAHADLGTKVLCGLMEHHEAWLDGSGNTDGGCIRGTRCKRMRPHHEQFIYFDSLPSRILFLLGCNTVAPVGHFFPTTGNLIESASRENYMAIIGVSGPVVVRAPLEDSLALARENELSLGELVKMLNTVCQPAYDSVFVLIGDPEIRLSAKNLGDKETPDPIASKLIPVQVDVDTASILSIFTSDGEPRDGIRLNGHLLVSGCEDLNLHVCNDGNRVQRDRKWLLETALRLENAASLERALVLANRHRLQVDEEFRQGVNCLAKARNEVDSACWLAIRDNEMAWRRGVVPPNYQEIISTVLDCVDGWASAAAMLHSTSVAAELLYHSAHYFDHLDSSEPGPFCARCGAVLRILRYRRDTDNVVRRTATECPICGPRSEVPTGNIPIGPDSVIVNGSRITAVFKARPVGNELPAARHSVLLVRNEAQGKTVVRSIANSLPHEDMILTADVPELPPELHTLSICTFATLDFEFQQERIVLRERK